MGFSGNAMPIAEKVKKLRAGLTAHTYNETGSNKEKVTRTIVENDGRKAGEYLKVGNKVVESSSTPDVKNAGIDISGECVATNPTKVSEDMDDDNQVQDKKEIEKEQKVNMLKKAAPVTFSSSFANTLKKVEKFRKRNELKKGKSHV